ncbi:hypothetical protein F5890DRAFT_1651302 [Lentinula detonsa]|uniref:Uncharacterized protein n=1 Tax=Lentinula detonsa TaxID=2804962 RepID=A0AA38ULU4_9AGAR|nr:hypothetical protein F5890DRAFT_1651302 [Lentinula detonsa]
MSNASNDNKTIQQRRERILQAQAARQQAREEEIARQEAEFAAEMDRIEAEEKAAREAEEKRKAEQQRVAEEKRKAEENRIAEEQRMEEQRPQEEEKRVAEEKKKLEVLAEKKRKEEQRLNEAKRREEEVTAEAEDNYERSTAYTRLVEENKKEKERAAKELERRRKSISKPPQPNVQVLVPTTSPRCKTFKSKAIISDESDDEVVEQLQEVMPRGAKRKRTIKMIAKGGDNLDPDVEKGDNTSLPPDPSQPHSACSRCVMIGRPSDYRPQSTQQPTQACEVCHQQRQQCSWSGDNAARRSRSKRVKLDEDDVYEGPAARVGERRRVEGTEVAEQLARIAEQNQDLVKLLRQSLIVQEQMLGIMVRAEKRVMEAMEESEEGEDEDEDGEGEEDEEEIENEEEKRAKIREGKKRAE